jgi:hypothetical protein
MTKDLTIEDLTKEEILVLFWNHLFYVSPSDIRRVRCDSLVKKAKEMADEANAEMKKYAGQPGMESRVGFSRASDKFDEAMKLYDEADKVLKG